MKRIFPFLLVLVLLSGCSSSQVSQSGQALGWTRLVGQHTMERSTGWAIDNNVNLYLVLPPQEQFDDDLFVQMTQAFQRYYPKTRPGAHRESLQQSFASAQFAGMDFLVFPKIRKLEPHVGMQQFVVKDVTYDEVKKVTKTRFGPLGVLDIDIMIFAANGEQLVDHIQFETQSGLFAEREEELLWAPLDDYLRSISQY